MDPTSIGKAIVLALVEGATEFIPVSSTGHQLLVGHFIGFHSPNNTFEVLIQLGAILAILAVYFRRLARDRHGAADRPAGAPLRARHPGGLPPGRDHRRHLLEGDQGLPVQSVDRLRDAGRGWTCAARRRRHRPRGEEDGRLRFHPADGLQDRHLPVPRHDPRRVALGRHHRGRDADGRRQALGHRILLLPGDADHGGRLRQGPARQLQIPVERRCRPDRDRLHRVVRRGALRRAGRSSTTSPATASGCSRGGGSSSARWVSPG